MKARESGMPEETYWESFFDADVVLKILFNASGSAGHLVEFGCGYGTFTVPAALQTQGIVTALDIDPQMMGHVQQFVMHWRSDIPTPRGPSLAIRPRPEQCQTWLEEAGFQNIEQVNLQPCCPYHFGLLARH